MLTVEQIVAANDVRIETVTVPEWGGDLCVRTISWQERQAGELTFDDMSGKLGSDVESSWAAFWVAFCMCDASGSLVCKCKPTIDTVRKIAAKGSKPVSRVMRVVNDLNFLSAGEVARAEKNSGGTQSASCGTGSQASGDAQ